MENDYEIISNRESGKGRCDLILKKKRGTFPNVVMEFKYVKNKKDDIINKTDLTILANSALQQIKDMNYMMGLQGETLLIGLAHKNKDVRIQYEIIHSKE